MAVACGPDILTILMPPVPGGEARAAMVDSLMNTHASPGNPAALLPGRQSWSDQPNFF